MEPVNFFGGAQPADLTTQQKMAQMLMKGGATPAQGSQVGNQYVPPSAANYAAQAAQGLAGAYQADQMRGAARAQDILNGGTGQTAAQTAMSNAGTWIKGLFGG